MVIVFATSAFWEFDVFAWTQNGWFCFAYNLFALISENLQRLTRTYSRMNSDGKDDRTYVRTCFYLRFELAFLCIARWPGISIRPFRGRWPSPLILFFLLNGSGCGARSDLPQHLQSTWLWGAVHAVPLCAFVSNNRVGKIEANDVYQIL